MTKYKTRLFIRANMITRLKIFYRYFRTGNEGTKYVVVFSTSDDDM